ncbi:MAG: TrkA C-terminal domain-containing protein [Spirochaetales bacterium]|nr:TrkA C-terminal domain-containing protein [Candidatus Physcosoma equi]
MSFVSSISLIITVIVIYYVLFQFYTVMFRITGITKDKATLQSVSLLTNAGYTTSESEIITGDKTRRAIAKAAMLTGYFFSVVIVSLFINLFLSVDFTRLDGELLIMLGGFAFLILFFGFLNIPSVKKWLDGQIDVITVKVFRKTAKENFISVLDSYGTDDAVCKVFLYKVPSSLEGKMIIDTDIKTRHNVNVLMYERKGQVRYVTRDTIFTSKDTILAFGPMESIRNVFLLKDHSHQNHEVKKEGPKNQNEISIINNYDYQILAEIELNKVPEVLKDKTLIESHIKDYFSINVMMASRDGKPINLTKDTILHEHDKVIAFGPYENIQTVFGEKIQTESVSEE